MWTRVFATFLPLQCCRWQGGDDICQQNLHFLFQNMLTYFCVKLWGLMEEEKSENVYLLCNWCAQRICNVAETNAKWSSSASSCEKAKDKSNLCILK